MGDTEELGQQAHPIRQVEKQHTEQIGKKSMHAMDNLSSLFPF
jgi:hypothetical protein